MKKLAWGLFLGLFLSLPVAAGVGVWTPEGGILPPSSRLVVDPTDPETLYALVFMSDPDSSYGIWKSTDGGESWRSIQNGIPPINQLVIDPLEPRRLYAYDLSNYPVPKLWRSEDGGETWEIRYDAEIDSHAPHFWQIVASPLRSGVLYGLADTTAGGPPFGSAIYRSADGGATWTPRGTVGTSRVSVESLLHHPARNRLEYFDNDGFYTSQDNGLTWTVRGTFRGQGFRYVTRSHAAPDRLYGIPAMGAPCLLRSDDGGARWTRTRRPDFPGSLACTSLAVAPDDPNLVWVKAEGQLRRRYVHMISTSRDGGATWSRPRSFPSSLPIAAGGDPATLFAAGGDGYSATGPYKSTDDGQTWTPSWDGIVTGDLRQALVALPTSGSDPLLVSVVRTAGFAGGRIARSLDGGATWELPALLGEFLNLEADANGRLLYALQLGADGVVRSTDGGLTWTETPPPVPIRLGSLFADPFQTGRVFVTTYEPTGPSQIVVWRTADAGTHWARRSAGLPIDCGHVASVDVCPFLYAVTSDPRDPERVLMSFGGDGGFLSADPGVFVSTNGGRRWRPAARQPPELVLTLAADPAPSGTVFLAGTTTGGIYRSVDGGDHWSKLVTSGLPVDAAVRKLLRDGQSGAWYAVTDNHGIFRSTDGGSTWAGINAGLPDPARPVVVVDPQIPGRLFAAVRGQGLWSWSAPGS